MWKRSPSCGLFVAVCLVAAGLQLAVAQPVSAQIDAKRSEAAALQSKIAEQGRALSLADEDFNSARIERQAIETKAAAARGQVDAASKRWGELKGQLARRVRLMYMHPGAALDAWLGTQTLSDLARAQKLGASVITADNELVNKTEKARHEVMARARTLEGLREQAANKEEELAGRRAQVTTALQRQRALLSNVRGEIADLMDEQRAQELARAEAAQASVDASTDDGEPESEMDSAGPPGDDDATEEAEDEQAPEEEEAPEEQPVGPAPPVKGGAGKAVATAAAQIGKPYEWAADGPDSFDCSGLTMYAWASAGVSLPHSSRAQYASLPHVARSQLQPGDLVFYGSPIHHVGIYEGGGVMINAPETGEFVRRNSIDRADYVGAARP